jgi:tetratricopeptide (TPR) repeat protein
VLAEEVLDVHPEDPDALGIIADAAPRYGHGEVGLLAARAAARSGGDTRTLQAAAYLTMCDVDAALTTADARLLDAPEDARAHAVRAQALDLLERPDEAAAAYAQALRLRPDAFPRPLVVPEAAWDEIVQAALSSLPFEARDTLRRVDLRVVEIPDLARLQTFSPPPNPTCDAWLDSEGKRPSITIHRRNLARGARSLDDLTHRVIRALETELDAFSELEEDS